MSGYKIIKDLDCDMRMIVWMAYEQASKDDGEVKEVTLSSGQVVTQTTINDMGKRMRDAIFQLLEIARVQAYYRNEFQEKLAPLQEAAAEAEVEGFPYPAEWRYGPSWDCKIPQEIYDDITRRFLSKHTDFSEIEHDRYMRVRKHWCDDEKTLRDEMMSLWKIKNLPEEEVEEMEERIANEEEDNGSEKVEVNVEQ